MGKEGEAGTIMTQTFRTRAEKMTQLREAVFFRMVEVMQRRICKEGLSEWVFSARKTICTIDFIAGLFRSFGGKGF